MKIEYIMNSRSHLLIYEMSYMNIFSTPLSIPYVAKHIHAATIPIQRLV